MNVQSTSLIPKLMHWMTQMGNWGEAVTVRILLKARTTAARMLKTFENMVEQGEIVGKTVWPWVQKGNKAY